MSEYARYIPNLEAVTPQQVAASVAAEIDPALASIVIVGRASEFLPALRAQYPNLEVIPIGELDFGSASLRAPPPGEHGSAIVARRGAACEMSGLGRGLQ